jgi:hypothetical protein
MKWFEVDISLNHDVMASFPLLNIWGGASLVGGNDIRMHPHALETA